MEIAVQQFVYLLHVLSLFLIIPSVSMVAVFGKKQLLWQLESRFSSKRVQVSKDESPLKAEPLINKTVAQVLFSGRTKLCLQCKCVCVTEKIIQ